MKKSKNLELLTSFTEYCTAHPQERFWQALRNWAELDYLLSQGKKEVGTTDTWYWENKNN